MTFLSNRIYFVLFSLLGLVYFAGLFVPLMDNDSAHHAGIALHMHLTGDYVSLIDHGGNYLDKPHLLFWLAAFCYKIFGVTSFAYKFPSLLFTILGTYSTYRLGRSLYDRETGKLAALLIATAFAYILSNNDVRMDAILTACIVFATWQLVEFVHTKKILHIVGAAAGLALGFSTKGHIAIITPAVAIFFYILYRQEWRLFLNWKWLLLVLLFAIFISPVVYSYYLQYNRHPEIVVRGKDHLDGVAFILWNQSVERYGGTMGKSAKNDYTFFLHSFIWAFGPWSIIAYMALFRRFVSFFSRRLEWLTTGGFTIVMLAISFSGYKLPHYVNILFPFAAIMSAHFILSVRENKKWINAIYITQFIIGILLLLLILGLNVWAFPVRQNWLIVATLMLGSFLYFFVQNQSAGKLQKSVIASAAVMIFSFFLLNTNFYPQLLTYQGGNQIAFKTKGKVNAANVYFWEGHYSPSYLFYTASLEKPFADSIMRPGKEVWILADESKIPDIQQRGYEILQSYSTIDYGITKLKLSFVNPATREKKCTHMVLLKVRKNYIGLF